MQTVNEVRTERAAAGQMARRPAGAAWQPGHIVTGCELVTITGDTIPIPDAERLVHLQFRRFAGCPVCNLHLHQMARRHDEVAAAGIREVVLFHSPAEELRRVQADSFPFAVVADPDKRLYAEFGVESSPRSLLDPRAWGTIFRAVRQSLKEIRRGQGAPPASNPHGGRFGLPADFLIAPGGRVIACKYGSHADDQWSVDELLRIARSDTGRVDP